MNRQGSFQSVKPFVRHFPVSETVDVTHKRYISGMVRGFFKLKRAQYFYFLTGIGGSNNALTIRGRILITEKFKILPAKH